MPHRRWDKWAINQIPINVAPGGTSAGRDAHRDVGIVAPTEQQPGRFRAGLVHLHAAVRPFSPELEPKAIPSKRIRQSDGRFEQGEPSRRLRDALCRAGEPRARRRLSCDGR